MRIPKLVYLTLLATTLGMTPVHADDELNAYADLQVIHAVNTIRGIAHALEESTLSIERSPDASEQTHHKTLAKYVDRTPGLRAIIVIDEKGMLTIDSFTYPAKDINLKDREYVKAATAMKTRDLYIGSPVVGRSSGAAFVPFATPVLSADKENLGVIAGVIHPGFLLNQESICARCFVGLFNNKNELLVTYPSDNRYPEAFLKKIQAQTEDGIIEMNIDAIDFISRIDINTKYGVKVVTSKFINNSE